LIFDRAHVMPRGPQASKASGSRQYREFRELA
jgi:hypothetical protein